LDSWFKCRGSRSSCARHGQAEVLTLQKRLRCIRDNSLARDIAGPIVDAMVQYLSLWYAVLTVPREGGGRKDTFL
jgi:hypothetical protein